MSGTGVVDVRVRDLHELRWWMEMTACECGRANEPDAASLDGDSSPGKIRDLQWACPTCNRIWRHRVTFGDPDPGAPPSALDPGQLIWLSTRAAEQVPVTPSPDDAVRIEHRRLLLEAADLLALVLAYIPADEDAVPEATIQLLASRTLFHAWPEKFTRSDLENRIDLYRRSAVLLS